jgi:hypothetical protein
MKPASRGLARALWPLLAGALGAAAFSVASHHFEAAPRARADEAPRADDAEQARSVVEAVVDRRLAAMAGALATRPSAAAEPTPVEPPRRPTEQEAALRLAAEVEQHQRLLASHADEPRVPAWAAKMENTIAQGFRGLPADGATRYENVDCRAHTCVTTLSWPSYDEARAAMQLVVTTGSGSGCAQRLTLPPGSGNGQRYQAQLLLDCPSAG